jgi:hypothetical protein
MAYFAERMTTLEHQSSTGSCSTIRPHHTPQHPYYEFLDKQSEDGNI